MPKTYTLKFLIDDAMAKAAIKRSISGLESIERAATRAGAAMDKAFAAVAATAQTSASRMNGAYADAMTKAVNGTAKANGKIMASATATANGTVATAVAAAAKIDTRILGSAATKKLTAAQVSALEDKFIKLDIDRTVAAEQAKAKAIKKSADERIRDAQRVADLQAKNVKPGFIGPMEPRIDVAFGKLYAQAGKLAKKSTDDQARELTRLDAIQDRLIKRDYSRRVAYENKKIQDAKRSSAAMTDSFAGFTTNAASFAAGMVGLESFGSVVNTITEAFDRARESAYQSTRMVDDYRNSLLELAALKDRLGDTTTELKEQLLFRAQTLQSAEAARSFQTTALGVGESAIDKPGQQRLITADQMAQAMINAGKFQAAEGGDARAHALGIGMLPQLIGHRTDAKEMAITQRQLYTIMKPAGFEYSTGIASLGKLAPDISAGLYGLKQATALLSAFGINKIEKGEAATEVEQFTRGTLGAVGRLRGPKMVEMQGMGYEAEKTGMYLKGLGADEAFLKNTPADQQALKIGDMIAADIAKQEAEAAKRGEAFNELVYFREKGYGNQDDVRALMDYARLKKVLPGATVSTMDTFMQAAEEKAAPTFQEAMSPLEKFGRTNLGQMRAAGLAEEASNLKTGVGAPEELLALKQAAFATLRAKAPDTMPFNKYEEVQAQKWFNPADFLFGYREKIQAEAMKALVREGDRVGAEMPKHRFDAKGGLEVARKDPLGREFFTNVFTVQDAELTDLQARIRARAGMIAPGLGDVVKGAEQAINAAKLREDLGDVMAAKVMGPPLPAPLGPVAPAAGMAPGGDQAAVIKLLTDQLRVQQQQLDAMKAGQLQPGRAPAPPPLLQGPPRAGAVRP